MVDVPVNGTLIWYYYICKREVWFISHGIEPNQENDLIALGRLIHEEYYRRAPKEISIDNRIKIDLTEGGKVIGEVKKSSRYLKSAKMQLLFYIYYLEKTRGVKARGVLLIPEERKRIYLSLTSEDEKEIEKAIKEIEEILKSSKPPELKRTQYCKNCGYRELCWS